VDWVLSKGFEVEMYTGLPTGQIVGLSDRIVANLDGFVREPDSRNVEYTTPPSYRYERLLCDLLTPRHNLRHYLQTLGDYTLLPGSTLSLGDSQTFHRSDPGNPYHTYIEQTYGTKVVTASIHINIGIADPDLLMRACRLVRMESALYLALSAASPFVDGEVTGYHSTRWGLFPKTPSQVPLFTSHRHFIDWTEQQLTLGTMQNVRHLWSCVRPNGDRRPYNLNRLELRICDLMIDPIALLAVTALLEARLLQMLQDPELDPLTQSQVPRAIEGEALVEIAEHNERMASKASLDAELIHWQTGQPILARDWIDELHATVSPFAKAAGFSCFLPPIQRLLREGNEAMRWLACIDQGQSVEQIIQAAIIQAHQQESALIQDVLLL
jgi:predicted glutamate--cysteine ligase